METKERENGAALIKETAGIRKRANAALKALLAEKGLTSVDILGKVSDGDCDEIGVVDASRQGDCHVTVEKVEARQCELVRITFRDGVTGDAYEGTMANLSADDCALLLREIEDIISAGDGE